MAKFNRVVFSIVLVIALLAIVPAQAQTYTDMVDLISASGCCPLYPAILAQGRDGNLYGTTLSGGTHGDGTVFVMNPTTGVVTTLFNFDGTHGSGPQAGLALGFDGNFYGTTYQGGTTPAGLIFKITPAGVLTVLYNFTNANDGAYPRQPPIPAPDGNLYGVTGNGTNYVVYRLTPSGTFAPIAAAPGYSWGPLLLGVDGKLYGTTLYGGTYNGGTAFQLTLGSSPKLKVIHSFSGPTGSQPAGGLMQGADGKLYGTASSGGTSSGGVVFQMSTAGAYKVLRNFISTAPATDGFDPMAGLVQGSDGFLYGVNQSGGANGLGTLFKINTSGSTYAVLHDFATATGANPTSTPVLHTNGKVYGMTSAGGAHLQGAIYSFDNALKPFASIFVIWSGKVGISVGILGQGFSNATGVKFGAGPGTFVATNDTYMTATAQAGATTAPVTVLEPGGNLITPQKFKVIPTISSISPTAGPVGTSVVITGMSLTQTSAVAFGGVKATTFVKNSDTQVTATVPTGALTGKVKITTLGGNATSAQTFTVQ